MGRVWQLDGLRAVAAVAVLVGHAYLLGGTAPAFDDYSLKATILNNLATGVWLFFVLSGFLIAGPFALALARGSALPGLRSYAVRRAARIYPAYWLAFVVVLLVWRHTSEISATQLATHALLLHNAVPHWQQQIFFASWTLTIEVLFYVAAPTAARLVRRARPGPIGIDRVAAAVIAVWAASTVWALAAGVFGTGETRVWLRFVLPGVLAMFCPGVLVALAHSDLGRAAGGPWAAYHRFVAHPVRALGLGAILVLVACLLTRTTYAPVYDLNRIPYAVAFGLLVGVVLTDVRVLRAPLRMLVPIGTISYGIYLWHAVLVAVLVEKGIDRLAPLPHPGALAYAVHVLYLATITAPVAVLSWFVVEKPMMNAARRWPHGPPKLTELVPQTLP